MPNYYVARIDYRYPYPFLDIRAELIAGRYRQGWGTSGCDLRLNKAQTFPHGKSRYDKLSLMLDIKQGDRIIIPKVNICMKASATDYITIAVCTAPYEFACLPKYNDYGHIIGVTVKGSWYRGRSHSNDPIDKAAYYIGRMIGNYWVGSCAAGKFDGCINKVDDSYYEMRFKEAVEYLIAPDKKNLEPCYYPSIQTFRRQESDDNSATPHRKEDELMPNLEDLIENNLEQQRKFWQEVLNNLHTLQPDDVLKAARSVCAEIFEKIVMNLFESDGFKRVADTNCLIFERNTIENAIYEMNGVDAPKIYVHLEKSGMSYAGALAQLEELRDVTNTRVLIALVNDFSDATKTAAKNKHIMLINGRQFAELIIKYASKSDS